MNIAIIDDEEEWLKKEKDNIKNFYNEKKIQIDTYFSGEELLKSDICYDLVFMDIELGEGKEDGFIILKKYQIKNKNVVLIIMTTHTEFSRKGYQVNAFRYIDKLCMKEELPEALNSVGERMDYNQFIEVPITGIGMQKILCNKIIYIETNNNTVFINTTTEKLLCQERLKDIVEKIENKGFYQVHRAYLVNLKWIDKFTEQNVYLKAGETVLMSRRRYQEFKRHYFQWKMKMANR